MLSKSPTIPFIPVCLNRFRRVPTKGKKVIIPLNSNIFKEAILAQNRPPAAILRKVHNAITALMRVNEVNAIDLKWNNPNGFNRFLYICPNSKRHDMSAKVVLVPTDFTPVAETALQHAIKAAEVIDGEVALLHVISKTKDVDEARVKLNEELNRISTLNPAMKITPVLKVGNIFDDIGDTASELGAELIFMGTHGATGWQKITGSNALKVIMNSETPFIVVQDKGIKGSGYDDIVVPLDLHKETKQKLSLVANIAKVFNGRVHLIVPHESDEFLKNKLDRNIHFAKQFLGERDISFTTKVAENSAFEAAIIHHAKEVDADLIAIMNHAGETILGLVGSNQSEQQLITNKEQIPVMVMNSKSIGVSGSVLFS